MASFIDITPALGRGLDFAQGQPGGYDAIDLRRAMSVGKQEGAVTALAYKVTQRSAGANMSVDVASDQGAFLVQGDDVTGQGLYHIPATPLKANLDIAAAHPTNPRVDQVVLEARDTAHTGDGVTRGRAYVKEGIPTAGATLDNAAGVTSRAVLPASTARLSEILVVPGASSIADDAIRDRRTTASPKTYRKARAIGVAFPTAAQSIADITFESNGRPYSIEARGAFQRQAGSGSLYAGIHVNGVPVGDGYTEVGYLGAMSAAQFGFWAKEALIAAPVGRQMIQLIVQFTAAAGDITSRSDQSLRVVEHI